MINTTIWILKLRTNEHLNIQLLRYFKEQKRFVVSFYIIRQKHRSLFHRHAFTNLATLYFSDRLGICKSKFESKQILVFPEWLCSQVISGVFNVFLVKMCYVQPLIAMMICFPFTILEINQFVELLGIIGVVFRIQLLLADSIQIYIRITPRVQRPSFNCNNLWLFTNIKVKVLRLFVLGFTIYLYSSFQLL